MARLAVDEAAARLEELRREEQEDLALAAVALGLAVLAAHVAPSLALPLFAGGLGAGVLGIRALWRRWDLVERLSGDPDAHVIPEVRRFAEREASLDRRRCLAALLRACVEEPGCGREARVAEAADDLLALADHLENPVLDLDPACAVACGRLLNDPDSPLLDPGRPACELEGAIRRIRWGFAPRAAAYPARDGSATAPTGSRVRRPARSRSSASSAAALAGSRMWSRANRAARRRDRHHSAPT